MQASVSYGYNGLRAIYEISKTLGVVFRLRPDHPGRTRDTHDPA